MPHLCAERECRRWSCSWKLCPSGFTGIYRQNIWRLLQTCVSLVVNLSKLSRLPTATAVAVQQWAVSFLFISRNLRKLLVAHDVRRAGVLMCGSRHLERSVRPRPHRGWSCQVPKTAEITLFSQAFNICWFLWFSLCFNFWMTFVMHLRSRFSCNGRTINLQYDVILMISISVNFRSLADVSVLWFHANVVSFVLFVPLLISSACKIFSCK